MKHQTRKRIYEKGFSLIELTVAVGLFAVVVTITSSSFITSLKGQQRAITSQNVGDNARYAMESIAKEMRMGKDFVLNSPSDIQFTSNMPNRSGKTIHFYLDAGKIMFDDDIDDGPGLGMDPEPITTTKVSINALWFTISPGSQPRITIVLDASSLGISPDVASSMVLQTTISPRSL